MPLQKGKLRGKSFRSGDSLSLESQEVLAECLVRAVVAEAFTQDQPEIFVEGDKVAIERGVLRCGEAKAVAGVEPVRDVVLPSHDVAGAEKFGDGDAGDAATVVVGGKDRFPKELLAPAGFHG